MKDPFYRNHLIRDAIHKAILEKMRVNPRVVIVGEGAHMKVHYDAPDIEKEFSERIVTLPISEGANTDFSLGLAIGGMVPIVDIITADFMLRAFDSICNTCAKHATVAEPHTMVIRGEFLTGGPTTGQRIESLFCHIPGLRVVLPCCAVDAYDLMLEALEYKGVTVFFEDRMISDEGAPEFSRILPGKARIYGSRQSKLTVVTYGLSTMWMHGFEHRTGIDFEHIDLRTLYPIDFETILRSVARTRRLLIVEPDTLYMGIGSEIAARVCVMSDVKIARCGAKRTVLPVTEGERVFPDKELIRSFMTDMVEA